MKTFGLSTAFCVLALTVLASDGCGKAVTVENPGEDSGVDSAVLTDGGQQDGGGGSDGGSGSDSGGDSGYKDDTGVNTDGGNPSDGGTPDGGAPECKTKDQCQLGFVCPEGKCVPGCEGVRDCPDGWKCDTAVPPHGLCAKCIEDKDCGASGYKCVGHECLSSCGGDPDCAKTPATPYCNKDKGVCVACTADSQCAQGKICIDWACVEGCHNDRDCAAPLKCDPAYGAHGKCFECVKDEHCSGGKVCVDHACSIDCSKITCSVEKPYCLPATGACVACIDKTQCRRGEVCRSNQCVAGCDVDGDCGAGLKCKPTGNGVCVECLETKDCLGGKICVGSSCVTGGCLTDAGCDSGQYCHPRLHTCETLPAKSCKTNDDCNKILYSDTCDPLTRACIPPCFYGLLCFDQVRIYCDAAVNGCYECLADSYCPGTDCRDLDNTCVKCSLDKDCVNPDWHCDTATGACRECIDNSHCTPELCDTTSHQCVQCLKSTDCKNPSLPICGKDETCIAQCTDACVKNAIMCDPADTSHESYLTCGDWDNDPCLEYGSSKYCPANQYCTGNKCVCKPATCTEGQYGCDSQYPTTVYRCQKDANGCLAWSVYYVCTNGSYCGETGCP